MKINFKKKINVKNLYCPLSILNTKKSLFFMKKNEILKIITNDFKSQKKFYIFSKQTKNKIIKTSILKHKKIIFFIKKR